MKSFLLSVCSLIAVTCFAGKVSAADNIDDYFEPNAIVGQWVQQINERPVEQITTVLRRYGDEGIPTVSLRFKDGPTFTTSDSTIVSSQQDPLTIVWRVSGEAPVGRPLVLTAANGRASVESVLVEYGKQTTSVVPKLPPITLPPVEPQQAAPAPPIIPPNDTIRTETLPPAAPTPPSRATEKGQPNEWIDSRPATGQPQRTLPSPAPNPRDVCSVVQIHPPKLETVRVTKITGLNADRYRFEGAVEGNCLDEVGYYEGGQLIERIPTRVDDQVGRDQFTVVVRSGRGGEIRAKALDGSSANLRIDGLVESGGWF